MTATPELRRAARDLLELAATPLNQIMLLTSQHREVVAEATLAMEAEVRDAWQAAVQAAGTHLGRVLGNNPFKTLDEILARPDVIQAMTAPFASAATLTRQRIADAWELGGDLGGAHAVELLARWNIDADAVAADGGEFLTSLLDDSSANAMATAGRLQAAMEAGAIHDVSALADDLARRAVLGVQVAARRSAAQSAEATMVAAVEETGIGIGKVWVTRFGPGTCGACAALHGTLLPLGAEFDHDATTGSRPLKVYLNLYAPPRHPNCRCQLVPWLAGDDPGGLAAMKAFASSWTDTSK